MPLSWAVGWGYGWSLVSPVLQQTKHVILLMLCQPCQKKSSAGAREAARATWLRAELPLASGQ